MEFVLSGIRKYSWSLIRHIVKVGTPRNGGSLPAPSMEGGKGEEREITFIPNQIELLSRGGGRHDYQIVKEGRCRK